MTRNYLICRISALANSLRILDEIPEDFDHLSNWALLDLLNTLEQLQ